MSQSRRQRDSIDQKAAQDGIRPTIAQPRPELAQRQIVRPALALALGVWLGVLGGTASLKASELQAALDTLRQVGPEGSGHQSAQAAWQQVAAAPVSELLTVLTAIEGADPLAANWLRAAAETIAQRELAAGRALPQAALEAYLFDTQRSPRTRRLAYELLVLADPAAVDRLVPRFLDDPSLELRRDAVARLVTEAEALEQTRDEAATLAKLQMAFEAARDHDQIKRLAELLEKHDQSVDITRHYGFVQEWKLIGPFDNTGSVAFDVAYPPELAIDTSATYLGKGAKQLRWIDHKTEDTMGKVDLNGALGAASGAVAYGVAEFYSTQDRDVELRISSVNASKIWLNGKLLTANNVYHTGEQFDKYTGRGRLLSGRNTILVKVLQNEQKENWAQVWGFQLRVCDLLGAAVLSDPAAVLAP